MTLKLTANFLIGYKPDQYCLVANAKGAFQMSSKLQKQCFKHSSNTNPVGYYFKTFGIRLMPTLCKPQTSLELP